MAAEYIQLTMDASQQAGVRCYRLRPVEELWNQSKQTRSQASYAKTLEAKRNRYATDEAYREQKKQASLAAKDIRQARQVLASASRHPL